MIRQLAFTLALALLSLTAGCHSSFGHRDQSRAPDARLDKLLDEYDAAKGGKGSALKGGHLVYDTERVRNEIERLVLEFPREPRVLLANGALAYEAREPEKAARYLDNLLAIEPASPDGAVLRSRISIDQGNLAGAKRLLTTQISYRPDHAGLHEALAAVLDLERDLAGARSELAVAERLKAPSWRIAYHRGLIAESAGDLSTAQREYQRSHDENPGFTAAKSRLEGARAVSGYNQGPTSGKPGGG